MKKIIFVLIFGFIVHNKCCLQNKNTITFFTGYGLYEAYHLGFNLTPPSKLYSIGLSSGVDNILNDDAGYFSISIEYNRVIFKKMLNNYSENKWYWNNKITFWKMDDPYYLWKSINICPSICRKFQLTSKFFIRTEFGPGFNIVVYNQRKTFEKVGWPYHVMPSYRILINYKI